MNGIIYGAYQDQLAPVLRGFQFLKRRDMMLIWGSRKNKGNPDEFVMPWHLRRSKKLWLLAICNIEGNKCLT